MKVFVVTVGDAKGRFQTKGVYRSLPGAHACVEDMKMKDSTWKKSPPWGSAVVWRNDEGDVLRIDLQVEVHP